jgi:hypothetical protein
MIYWSVENVFSSQRINRMVRLYFGSRHFQVTIVSTLSLSIDTRRNIRYIKGARVC